MKDSEILKEAKQIIQAGKEEWICYAINKVDKATPHQIESLHKWIDHMLGVHAFYSSWLREHHLNFYKQVKDNKYKKGRLAWLDWMIDYCEKEEAEKVSKPIILNNKSRPIKELR